ncbi:MAG: ABC transporter ATP-binding protein, partial [Candidatus Nanoarchaeia archaeon]
MSIRQSAISHVRRDAEKEIKVRPIDYKIFLRIFSYSRPYAFKRNILFLLVILRAVQLPILTWGIGAIINGPVQERNALRIIVGITAFLLFSAFTQICFYFRSKLAQEIGENVIHDIRRDMIHRLITMPMGFFSNTRLGRIISRFTSDSEAVRVGIQSVVFVSMVQLGNMLIAAGLMAYYDWKLFLIVMSVSPIIWAINKHFRLRLMNAYREVQESFSRVSASVVESIKGIKIIQGYSREKTNARLFRELLEDHSSYNIKVAENEAVFLPLLELNSQFFLSSLIIIGGYRVLS